ncbi:MAG: DeoR family transcriptional regulator [Candidatus Aenigmatarchaeota archaeon]
MLDDLNRRQKEAIEYLKEHKSIKSGDLNEMFPQVSRETIRKDLKDLTERGILKKTGAKRGTEYTFT